MTALECGCEHTDWLQRWCTAHLDEKIEAIYAKWPFLRDWPKGCCGGCTASDIAAEHGWEAANVWDWELSGLLYLAGAE